MASSAELALILSLVDDVSKTARDVKGELEGVGKQGMSVQKIVSDLGNIGFGILKAGAIVGAAAIAGIGAALTSCVKDAMDYQAVAAQTAAVIKSTGGAAGVTAEEVLAMADALQTTTRFSDDAILQGQNLLLTFTNIGEDVFPLATEAMLDMATAMGTDASGSAIQLGKALNDPTKGITALTRVGVVFTEEQKNLIKSLQESGDLAGAQAVILQELQKEFGGSAEAAGKTFAGQLDILKNTFDDLKKGIGMKFLPVLQQLGTALTTALAKPEVKAAIDSIVAAIGKFAEGLGEVIALVLQGDLEGALSRIFGSEVAARIIEIATAIGGFVSQVATFVKDHAEAFKGALIAIGAILAGAMIVTSITKIAGVIGSLASPVGIIVAAVGLLGAAWASNWGGIQEKTKAVIDWLTPYVNGAISAISTWWAANGATIIATVVATWEWIKQAFTDAVAYIGPIVTGFINAISTWWAENGTTVIASVTATWEWIKTAFTDAVAFIGPIVSGALTAISTWWAENGATIIASITATWKWIKMAFQAAVDFIKPIVENALKAIKGWWDENGASVLAGVTYQAAFGIIKSTVESALNMIKSWWDANGAQVLASVTATWEFIKGAFVTYFAIVQGVVETVWAVIKGIWERYGGEITAVITNVWEIIKTVFSTAFGVIKDLFDAFSLLFQGDVGGFALKIDEAFDTLWEGVKTVVSLAWDNIRLVAAVAMDAMHLALETAWGYIKQLFIDAWEGIKQAVVDAWAAICQAVTDAWEGFKTAITNLLTAAIKIFTDTNWGQLGIDIITGIAAGITSAAKVIWDAIMAAINSVIDWILDQFGIPHAMGLSFNVDYSALNQARAAAAMPMSITSGAQWGGNQAGVAAGNTYNYNMTINTSAPAEDIIADYAILEAMAGA
jgi:phage-related protein